MLRASGVIGGRCVCVLRVGVMCTFKWLNEQKT